MTINYIQLIGILIQEGSALLADAALIQADQAVTSPPVVPTIAGHKYSIVVNLTPVPGQAHIAPQSVSWFAVIGLVLQEAPALMAAMSEIEAGQAFATPSVDVTLAGYKFAATIVGTPVA